MSAAPAAQPAPPTGGSTGQQRRVSARLAAIAESATLAVDAKAKALKAQGRPVIGFGAGEPDFPTPADVVEVAAAACRDPRNHRYTPAGGLPEMKAAVVAKTARDSGYEVAPEQVLVTNGGKQAVYTAFAALCDPGDEVLLPAPYWTTYPEAVRLAGGVPVEVFAGEEQDYLVTVEQLEAARTPRTKVLLFCSPSNPTGSVYDEAQVRAIGEWALEHGLWVVTDEIYEHLLYDGAAAPSMPVVVPDLADRTLVLNGVAKTYAMTGWRVGWLIGPRDVVKAGTNLQSHLTSNVADVSQRAAVAALTGSLDAVAHMREAFDRRRRTMVEMLSAIDGVDCPTPRGAFYAYPSVKALLGRSIRGRVPTTSAELATLLLEEAEVAVVPGEAFGPSGYLRLSYALGDEDLVEGVSRIQRVLGEAR
ncbi:pyridoxal phosphate-dependent aminotransferase [Quadrisphaera sp. KR29]|uniref:pyridoxal phosphate-dependent aminotransferase n=1 Tax=Quadrisphaera sp. KR29 TaxID=3461391 RepID=UPI004044C25E